MQKLIVKEWIVFLALLVLSVVKAHASETDSPTATLNLKPARCVALHQGQVCYQSLKIYWSAHKTGDYCLHHKDTQTALGCWESAASGEMVYEFSSDRSTALHLVHKVDGQIIAEAIIEVAWVYDSNRRRKSHWRVF